VPLHEINMSVSASVIPPANEFILVVVAVPAVIQIFEMLPPMKSAFHEVELAP
jgi:hypothetical protein